MAQVIVVGGGLTGLSAAHTVLERGGNVVVIDKMAFFGGNSTKATSGINGALTKTQIKAGIPDSVEQFYADTAKSARDLIRPPLVQVLTGNSASAVEWLQTKFALDLSLVSRLGGHSFPRTHRGKERFPGMTITYALMEKYDEICKTHPHRARSITKAQVTKLLKDNEGRVIGVEYNREGVAGQEYGPVILATGGYAADFSETSLLKKYRPDIYDLPTTNGDYSTGDGIKMGLEIGANAIDLEKVQVHPTGLVDPKEPNAKVKFLAAEALRGVGGLLLDANGNRFCDELGHRDYVTGKMWENKGPFRLILNKAAAQTIEWHCKHYMGRGLMRKFSHGKDIASDMGISTDKLQSTFKAYNEIAKSGKCPFGKKYFEAIPFDVSDEFYVAIVTPVLHFCMGGLEINAESEVLGAGLKPVAGLFAGGEVAGGVHGANRLGGSSLLGCVVYGRVSGDSAARYLLSNLATGNAGLRRAGAVAAQVGDFSIGATVSPASNKVTLELSWNEKGAVVAAPAAASAAAPVAAAPAPAAAAAPAAPTKKEYTLDEIAKHNKETDCWVIINGEVLDVTAFLKDHPGGKKAILLFAGRDASEEFNMLHKPDVIAKYSPESVIGTVKGAKAKL